MEVFCPGRFAEQVGSLGCVSVGTLDLSCGWDWSRLDPRRAAELLIDQAHSNLLMMRPPCGPLSPLQNMTPDHIAFFSCNCLSTIMVRSVNCSNPKYTHYAVQVRLIRAKSIVQVRR